MAKIVITGHTGVIGQALQKHFIDNGDEVVGCSRSNGYDVDVNFWRIVEEAREADLFINCANAHRCQPEFIRALHQEVDIVTIGSIASDFPMMYEYGLNKQVTQQTHKFFVKNTPKNMLLINVGYIDHIGVDAVIDAIEYWKKHKNVSIIDIENPIEVYNGQLGTPTGHS